MTVPRFEGCEDELEALTIRVERKDGRRVQLGSTRVHLRMNESLRNAVFSKQSHAECGPLPIMQKMFTLFARRHRTRRKDYGAREQMMVIWAAFHQSSLNLLMLARRGWSLPRSHSPWIKPGASEIARLQLRVLPDGSRTEDACLGGTTSTRSILPSHQSSVRIELRSKCIT